ncbi:MAG: glucokinase [Bacteroidetes bacterium MED-G21]|nr:MAG: glucokinase [Bacteroidetes bacterium MED-G21]
MNKNVLAVGIDIGGTNTVFGLVDYLGNCVSHDSIKTSHFELVEDFVDAVCLKLTKLIADQADAEIIGVGIGAPNGNYFSGNIEFAPNLNWKGIIPLSRLFEEQLNIPTTLTNDANAAALGERIYGAAKGVDNFVMVTLGTGLGSGFVVNGDLVYGHDGFAGELGHTIVEKNGRLCGCGRRGCLETYVSATGIVKSAKEFLKKSSNSSLSDLQFITSKSISDAAIAGDKLALEIFDFTAEKLGLSLANTIAISSPKLIVLFGGLAQSGDLLIKPTKKYLEEYVLSIYKNKIEIVSSKLNASDAAILGASALAWKH